MKADALPAVVLFDASSREMLRTVIVITSFLIVTIEATAQHHAGARSKRYQSPDKALVVLITSVAATQESSCEFRSASGKVLARRRFSSPDGEHGFHITSAAWTPDSQFFVYSMESTGGHQPWHRPVEFYSRRAAHTFSLDNAVQDAVMDSQFEIKAPDKVTVDLSFAKQKRTFALSPLHPAK